MATRFLLVDDHPLVREGLALTLARVTAEVEILEAGSAEDAVQVLDSCAGQATDGETIDMIVLDLELPGMRGLHAVEAVLRAASGIPLVILAGQARPEVVRKVLEMGTRGFIPKSAPSAELLRAFQFVFSGGRYLPVEVALSLPGEPEPSLTPRQQRVLRMLSSGASTRDIASALGLAEATVRVHVQAIVKALGVKTREEAIASPLVATLLGT